MDVFIILYNKPKAKGLAPAVLDLMQDRLIMDSNYFHNIMHFVLILVGDNNDFERHCKHYIDNSLSKSKNILEKEAVASQCLNVECV
jgi:hypothetical protein